MKVFKKVPKKSRKCKKKQKKVLKKLKIDEKVFFLIFPK